MKAAVLSATAIATLLTAGVATPSSAQPYGYGRVDEACQARQHDRGTTGAVVGGLAGALLGSNLASHHGGRAGGAAIGAIAGALLGNTIGRSSGLSTEPCQVRDAREAYYHGEARPYAAYAPTYAPAYGGYRDYARGQESYRHRYQPSGYDPYSY